MQRVLEIEPIGSNWDSKPELSAQETIVRMGKRDVPAIKKTKHKDWTRDSNGTQKVTVGFASFRPGRAVLPGR